MQVKDDLVRWFIRNIALPRVEIINHPGFIVTRFSDKAGDVFMRELFFPEPIFVDLERRLVDSYGDKGGQVLYSAGKKFGYLYSMLSRFPHVSETSTKGINKFIYEFSRYGECMWSSELNLKTDLPKREFRLQTRDYIICSKSGLGHLMSSGLSAGFWSYILGDPTVEAVQTKCQGRGDRYCIVVSGPPESLKGYKIFREQSLEGLLERNETKYREINKIREPQYAQTSFKSLLESHLFKQVGGIVSHAGFRHFLCEASLFYLLEIELKKLDKGNDTLFDCSYDYGKSLARTQEPNTYSRYVSNYLSAIGFGDVLVSTRIGNIACKSLFFPWTELADYIEFSLFSGLCSGLLSGFLNQEIRLRRVDKKLVGDSFSIAVGK